MIYGRTSEKYSTHFIIKTNIPHDYEDNTKCCNVDGNFVLRFTINFEGL